MSRVIDAVIFDLDGVLVDSQPAALKAIIDTLAEYGIDLIDSEVREQVGGGTRKYLRFFLEKKLDLDQVDECIDEATDRKNNLQMGYTDRVGLLPLSERLLTTKGQWL
jgi:beta-phosphoglucomutase-like phosphatase (HAD superfamily)